MKGNWLLFAFFVFVLGYLAWLIYSQWNFTKMLNKSAANARKAKLDKSVAKYAENGNIRHTETEKNAITVPEILGSEGEEARQEKSETSGEKSD